MILLVGGAGYVGSHVNKELNRKGFETVVFDNLICGHRELIKWGEFVQGDLANPGEIEHCFKAFPITAVVHLCAFAYVRESAAQPAKYYRNNVAGTLNLLDAMRAFGVRGFVFSSTCATYGRPEKIPITEDHALRPVSPYGRTKRMVEEILEDYDRAYRFPHVNLRYFNAAGADPEGEVGEWHEPETHLIPLAILAALGRGPAVRILGTDHPTPDGTCIRDYIHVADIAQAHVLALEYLAASGKSESFNLGNGAGYSVLAVIKAIEDFSGRKIRVIRKKRHEADPPILVASSNKAERALGWKPRYSDLPTIVETAWRWHSRQA
jgi:UDP-glucose 4-epimerase